MNPRRNLSSANYKSPTLAGEAFDFASDFVFADLRAAVGPTAGV
jgi:hypothetical protein